MTNEVALPAPAARAAIALNTAETAAKLAEMAEGSKRIVEITNAAGYQECHAARMALKSKRVEIGKAGKAARDDATAYSKAVIAEEAKLIGIIEPEETRLAAIQTAHDNRVALERQAKIDAENARVGAINERIAAIRSMPDRVTDTTIAGLEVAIAKVGEMVLVPDKYEEKMQEATEALALAKARLGDMLASAQTREAEAAKIVAEREELARLRAAAAEQAEREREEQRQRAAADAAEAKAAREMQEAKLAAERAEFEQQQKIAAVARAKADVEAAAERDRLATEAQVERQRQAQVMRQKLADEAQRLAETKRLAEEEAARVKAEQDAKAEELRRQAAAIEEQRLAQEQRAAEEQRLKDEAEQKLKAEAAALVKKNFKPDRTQIVAAVANHFSVTDKKADGWLVEVFGVNSQP